jgi:hypothetical protein
MSGAVPLDLDYLARFMPGGRHGTAGSAFIQMTDAVKADAAFHVYVPGPRDIRALWAMDHQCWTYYSLTEPNTIPFVAHGFYGAMNHLCRKVFNPAPILSPFRSYPLFNFEHDVLFLDYTHCGTSDELKNEYGKAIRSAIGHLGAYHDLFPLLPKLKTLKISYCPQMFSQEDLPACNYVLAHMAGVENIILVPHKE